MNVRIYQINMKRDANNVAFMNYESLPKFQGSSEIDSSLYDKVFEGEVNCFTLENLYEIFNLEHPAGYKGRSMSVSDVVEIIDGNTGKSYFHFCDSFGFQKVDFDPEKTQVSDRFLSLAEQEKISVLLVPVGKSPIVKEIPNTYEAMKELVGGGGLDEYMPFDLLNQCIDILIHSRKTLRCFRNHGILRIGSLNRTAHRRCCILCIFKQFIQNLCNAFCLTSGFLCQLTDFISHYSKPFSGFPCTGTLNRSIERQQIGLTGNGKDGICNTLYCLGTLL